ncbi:MAG: heavy metal sensor histidine kinase [Thermodesulfobacteriota bacterium]
MSIRSIKARLTLWYTGLLGIAFLLLGGVGYGLMAYSLLHDVDRALNGVGRVLADRAQREAALIPPPDIDDLFRRFFGFSPWDRYFGLFDPKGRLDPRTSPSGPGKLRLSPEALRNAAEGRPTYETLEDAGTHPVRILTLPVMRAGRLVNLIQVGMSLEIAEATRRRFLMILAAVFPLALLVAGGGGWLLARRALGPVDRMAVTARRISMENLTERLSDPGAGDEVSHLAQTLNEMLGRLQDSFRQVRQFSADASHELQTPLTILKGEIEVALNAPRTPEEYRRILKSALEEVDRLARLVEGLLLLARADAGVLRMDRKAVDLARLAEEAFGQGRILAEARGVRLSLDPVEPVPIEGDGERLGRVLLNLLDNAIKYTPAGGRVTLSVGRDKGFAFLKVEDTGIGLSPEEQEKIFERFYRSAEARSGGEGGAGLGLCIARSIVEAHGGSIAVKSTPGSGSSFTVFLPLPS